MTENMQKIKGIFALISMPFKDNGDVDIEEFGKLATEYKVVLRNHPWK